MQDETVWAAVKWKMHHSISYADAFAVATAERLRATLLTSDPELTRMTSKVRIERLTRVNR